MSIIFDSWSYSSQAHRPRATYISELHDKKCIMCYLLIGTMLVTGGFDSTVALWDVIGDQPAQKLRLQVSKKCNLML